MAWAFSNLFEKLTLMHMKLLTEQIVVMYSAYFIVT